MLLFVYFKVCGPKFYRLHISTNFNIYHNFDFVRHKYRANPVKVQKFTTLNFIAVKFRAEVALPVN